MFHMMNEARIGVGLGATMLGYTGYLHALEYARSRPQGRPVGPAGKDPASRRCESSSTPTSSACCWRRRRMPRAHWPQPVLRPPDRRGAHGRDRAESARDATLLLDILTPVAKSWPSQWCLEANALAIQVHGGYGYTRDYPVEQFYRDNRLNAIHEGTHGIQALDLLGRKVVMDEGAAFRLLGERIEDTVHRASHAPHPDTQRWSAMLADRVRRLATVTKRAWSAGDAAVTLANATPYLEAFGHVVLAWIWLEQSLAASHHYQRAEADFYHGKWQACRYFFLYELPKVDPMLELVASLDTTTLNMKDEWF